MIRATSRIATSWPSTSKMSKKCTPTNAIFFVIIAVPCYCTCFHNCKKLFTKLKIEAHHIEKISLLYTVREGSKKKCKFMVFDHNWGGGGQPEPYPYCKTPLFLKHYIHLQLYSICSCREGLKKKPKTSDFV